jgi:hypothetical protein
MKILNENEVKKKGVWDKMFPTTEPQPEPLSERLRCLEQRVELIEEKVMEKKTETFLDTLTITPEQKEILKKLINKDEPSKNTPFSQR